MALGRRSSSAEECPLAMSSDSYVAVISGFPAATTTLRGGSPVIRCEKRYNATHNSSRSLDFRGSMSFVLAGATQSQVELAVAVPLAKSSK